MHELLAERWRQLGKQSQCRLRPPKFKPCFSVSTPTCRRCTKSARRQESEVHITSIKCSCERCKMSSLSAAPSSSEFCGSKLLLASLEPPPMPSASKSYADTWKTPVASLEDPPMPSVSRSYADTWKTPVASSEDPPMPSVSRSCSELWKTAIASLKTPPIPSASNGGQGENQIQKKRRGIGTVLRKPASQSQATPEEPSHVELDCGGFFFFAEAWQTS